MEPSSIHHHDHRRTALLLIAGVTLFRILYAVFYQLDLAGDEAYYWDWGRRLDWGYYSKPPLIAWLMRLVTEVGGIHTLSIRVAAALIGAGSLLCIYGLASSIYGGRAGLFAVLISIASPANTFLSTMLTIDAPLVFFWSASLFFFWNWFSGKQPALSIALLTLTLGLGYLSKQMMMVFPVLALLFIGFGAGPEKRRDCIRSPGLWIAIAVSLTFIIPNLLWNARNGWVMLKHTGGQIAGDPERDPFGLTFFKFAGTQAGIVSPLLWFFIMAALALGIRKFRGLNSPEKYLLFFSAPALLVVYLMSLWREMLPNWPAVYYVSAIVLTAGWLSGSGALPALKESWKKLRRPAFVLGFIMVAAVYLLPPILDFAGYAGHAKADPLRRLRGHSETAADAAMYFENLPNPEKTIVLVAQGHRYHPSHLAFYLPDHPRVYLWDPIDQISSQYQLWPDAVEDGKKGWDALVFMPDRNRNMRSRFISGFDELKQIGEFSVEVSPHYEIYYRVYLGRSLNEWPLRVPPKEPETQDLNSIQQG